MSSYDMAIIITVDADNYDEASKIAKDIAAGLGDCEQISASAEYGYEHDNEGQRVYYLHPETTTREA